MNKGSNGCSRRQFFRGGVSAIAASAFAAPGKTREPVAPQTLQAPPPLNTTTRALRVPTLDELHRIAQSFGMDLSVDELASMREEMGGLLEKYRRLDQFVERTPPAKYPRDTGYRPTPDQNPFNAWYWRCSIKGRPTGKLTGKKIALKDNICLAGIPMMVGSLIMEGFVPDVDATVVTRILDAGGEIAGKAVCESLCLSGESYTSDTGPVLNPHNPKRTSGGSSSGSAALLAAEQCDMALGCDQGGSIRIPSSYCGVCGLKPTYGLVPYTAIFPFEMTLDHVGPMARTAADCALLLEAIAGPDGLDPRQPTNAHVESYTHQLAGHARGLRVGIVREGFGWPGVSEADVDEIVSDAAHRLSQTGAHVKEISIPLHREAADIFVPLATAGATMLLMSGNAMGTGWKGYYTTSMMDYFARSRRIRANDFSTIFKKLVLFGQYMHDNYQLHYYAKAQNVAPVLRAAYDNAFREVEVLAMPTTPSKAPLIPPPGKTDTGDKGAGNNTGAFDITGHPALSIPCGVSGGLPVGMMLVGRQWEDGTVLRVGDAFEQLRR